MKKLLLALLCLGTALPATAENTIRFPGADDTITSGWWIAPIAAVIALAFALIFYKWIVFRRQ